MKLTVTSIGDVTDRGNVTVVMSRSIEVETDLGTMPAMDHYRMVVVANTLSKAVGDEVNIPCEQESDPFMVEIRPYTFPEGHERKGETVQLQWFKTRAAA